MTEELRKLITESNPGLEGWATVEKALAMAELIEEVRPNLVVELGVFGGRSLIPQAMALREQRFGCIVGVDPWRIDPVLEGGLSKENADWWKNNVDLNKVHQFFMDALHRYGLEDWVVVMRSTSTQVAPLLPPIDIIYVDGNHTQLASCRDVLTYLPKVRKGGYIWFDDTDWDTTAQAVQILNDSCEKIKQVENCALFRKNSD